MASINWIGGSASWGDAADWSGGTAPGPADTVTIAVPGAVVSVDSTVTTTVGSITLTSGAELLIDGGALSANPSYSPA
jgi:hypothetical protein